MFWFIVAVIFFVLWISKKPKSQDITIDTQSSYDQGFWDGWRAFGKKVHSDITKDTVTKEKLQSYVNAGSTGVIPGESTATPPTAISTLPTTEAPTPLTVTAPISNDAPTTIQLEATPEDKERLALKNLNTMLYVASFLLIGAAAAFIAASGTPPEVRLILLWITAGLFYGSGLILHVRSKRFQPAALAFAGTGLAILPFAGLALTMLADVPGQVAWFITSLVGIIAYGAATLVLRYAVVAYLTMAFVLSLATASTSMLQLPLVWGFVVVMVVALLAHFVATLWPSSLPDAFKTPVEQTGQYVTPLALIASLTTVTQLSSGEFTLIFSVAALQYIVFWAQKRTYANETIARALLIIALSLLGFTIGEESALFITIWHTALLLISAAYSLIRVRTQSPDNLQQESAWLAITLGGLVCTLGGWMQTDIPDIGVTITLVLVTFVAAAATFRLRHISWAYVCLIASVILPFSVGEWATNITWYEDAYPWIFLAASFAALLGVYLCKKANKSLPVQQFTVAAFWAYTIVATVMMLVLYGSPLSLWVILFATLAATSTIVFSYIRNIIASEAIAIGYIALAITSVVWNTSDIHTWHSLIIVGTLYLVLLIGGLVHSLRAEAERTTWILSIGQGVALFFALGIAQDETRLASTLLLLTAAVGAGVRYLVTKTSTTLDQLYAVSTAPYLILAWASSLTLAQGWQILILGSAATIYWAISYRAVQPYITVVANVAALGAVVTLFSWIDAPVEWRALLIGWVATALFAAWYGITLWMRDIDRAWIHIASIWTILAAAALLSITAEKAIALSACATLISLAGFIGAHGYVLRRTTYFDTTIAVVSFAVQAAIYIQWPETAITVYGHITAATILGIALWRRAHGQSRIMHYFLAAGSLTLGAAISAFTENTVYQLIFLVEHVIILIIGGFKQWQKVVWWGVASTVGAILYFLRDYFFLWLAFLGIVLIAIVIWRLSVLNKPKSE